MSPFINSQEDPKWGPCSRAQATHKAEQDAKHTSAAQAQDEVKGGLLLDVVVGEGAAVLELLAGEDQALLVRGDALLVLDLGLDVLDGVRGLHIEGDGLTREGLDEDLHLERRGVVRRRKKINEEEKNVHTHARESTATATTPQPQTHTHTHTTKRKKGAAKKNTAPTARGRQQPRS